MREFAKETMRELNADELERVGGGFGFRLPRPRFPRPRFPGGGGGGGNKNRRSLSDVVRQLTDLAKRFR
ncbi:MAG: hypothetical protein ACR2RA_08365 [Geminicoccaceae bacterium]